MNVIHLDHPIHWTRNTPVAPVVTEPHLPTDVRYTMSREEAITIMCEAARIAADPHNNAYSSLVLPAGRTAWTHDGDPSTHFSPISQILEVTEGAVSLSARDPGTRAEIHQTIAFIAELRDAFEITPDELAARARESVQTFIEFVEGGAAATPKRRASPR